MPPHCSAGSKRFSTSDRNVAPKGDVSSSAKYLTRPGKKGHNMNNKRPLLRRFAAHRLEGALQFRASQVRVGRTASEFALPDLSGRTVRLSDYRSKSYVVLMFGSVTCGATVTQLRAADPSIGSLYAQYKKKGFEFFFVYSKEPHPGENILQPKTIQERVNNALRLKREEKVKFPILIDPVENTVRKIYRGFSNGSFIINREGLLVFRSSWTSGSELAQVLHDFHAWEKAKARNELVRIYYSERLVGLLRNRKISARVHWRAGPKAAQDFAHLLQTEGKAG
jgi:hypothetical protein